MANLTREQCDAFAEAVHERLGYLIRARERMEKGGFTSDPLYAKVRAAADALHTLWVAAHYASSPCGTGQTPRERE
jgi:hypothetical protein